MEQFDVSLIKHTQLKNIESCKDPEHAVVKGYATLYTRLGAIKCEYSNFEVHI